MMKAKAKKQPVPLEVSMLEDGLTRLHTISARQPLPTQHFYKELDEIVRDAVAFAYQAGREDERGDTETFPIEKFKSA